MRPAFLGLEVALRALRANQLALETTSHNIANANTPGYSRQEVEMAASRPYTIPTLAGYPFAGQVGTGVIATAMRRYRDAFTDLQLRQEQRTLGMWNAIKDVVQQVELIFNEPSDSGLNKLLDQFWNTWQDLANEPQSSAVRASVRQQAANLCTVLNHTYQQLYDLQHNQDQQILTKIDEINSIAQQIAALNEEIQKVQVTGNRPNDLMDQRDLLLDRLSTIVNITYHEGDNGITNVFIGSMPLVYDLKANSISAESQGGVLSLKWTSSGYDVEVTSGELKGILVSRDEVLGGKLEQLDRIAQALYTAVNSAHNAGYGLNGSTGLDFFSDPTPGDAVSARDITLSGEILDSLDNIAASSAADTPGDGSNAAVIAALRWQQMAALDNTTINGYYNGVITELGTYSKAAQDTCANQELLVSHLRQQREALSGVSLDEEAANLIKYERAYQAAARVMTTVDETLDRLINGTGRVGL